MKGTAILPGLILESVQLVSRVKPQLAKTKTAAGRTRKGARVEREIAELHEAIGIAACRVRRSGALANRLGPTFAADLKIWALGPDAAPLIAEVKSRAGGGGFVQLERWLGGHDLLILKRNTVPPMVVVTWSTWAALLARKGQCA